MGPARKEEVQGGLGKHSNCQSHPERMWKSKVTTQEPHAGKSRGGRCFSSKARSAASCQGWSPGMEQLCSAAAVSLTHHNIPRAQGFNCVPSCLLILLLSSCFPICTVGVMLAFAFRVLEGIRGDGVQKALGHMKHVHCPSSLLSPMSLSRDFPIHQPSTPVP